MAATTNGGVSMQVDFGKLGDFANINLRVLTKLSTQGRESFCSGTSGEKEWTEQQPLWKGHGSFTESQADVIQQRALANKANSTVGHISSSLDNRLRGCFPPMVLV